MFIRLRDDSHRSYYLGTMTEPDNSRLLLKVSEVAAAPGSYARDASALLLLALQKYGSFEAALAAVRQLPDPAGAVSAEPATAYYLLLFWPHGYRLAGPFVDAASARDIGERLREEFETLQCDYVATADVQQIARTKAPVGAEWYLLAWSPMHVVQIGPFASEHHARQWNPSDATPLPAELQRHWAQRVFFKASATASLPTPPVHVLTNRLEVLRADLARVLPRAGL